MTSGEFHQVFSLQDLQAEIDALRVENAELRAALESIPEFIWFYGDSLPVGIENPDRYDLSGAYCVSCWGCETHKPDCQRQFALGLAVKP